MLARGGNARKVLSADAHAFSHALVLEDTQQVALDELQNRGFEAHQLFARKAASVHILQLLQKRLFPAVGSAQNQNELSDAFLALVLLNTLAQHALHLCVAHLLRRPSTARARCILVINRVLGLHARRQRRATRCSMLLPSYICWNLASWY